MHTNISIMEISEEERAQRVFGELMPENFLKLMKNINLHITEPWKNPSRTNSRDLFGVCPRDIQTCSQTVKIKRWRLNPDCSKREETHHGQGVLNKINSWLLNRNYMGQKAVRWHIWCAKGKRLPTKNFRLAKNYTLKLKERGA